MHTTTCGGTTFVHNGDYSGEIFIIGRETDGGNTVRVETTMKDLVQFVAESIRDELIGSVEQAGADELLKMSVALGVKLPWEG